MDDLQRTAAHLRDLGRGKPTAKRRREVEELLHSKWEGIQVSAARVLAAWGGDESVVALRGWLADGRANRNETVVHAAAKALGACVDEDDVQWALDLHYELFSEGWGFTSWPLVVGLPRAPTVDRLGTERKRGSANRRAAEVALRWIELQPKG